MRRDNSRNLNHVSAMLLALGVLLVGAMDMTQAAAATHDIAVNSSTDDAEENASTGAMTLSSTDLEMPWDRRKRQQMGMRFQNVIIPAGVTITKAYIQFTVDRADTGGVVNLTVKGQKAVAPVRFSTASYDISSRPRTTAAVNWLPSSWTTAGDNGANQRTPDLSVILQEVIGQAGWASGNPVVLIIEDNGGANRAFRAARTFDGASGAPVLHVEYGTAAPGGSGFQQDGSGLLSMEAEHFHASVVSADGHAWLSAGASFGGYSGTDALRALPEDNISNATNYASLSPRMDYQVNFARTGTHYVWVRAQGPSTSSDAVHVGLDGQEISSSKNIVVPAGGYLWVGTKANGARATLSIGTAGMHTVNVWMNESGMVIDKLVLTTDAAFNPSTFNGGLGPNESPQGSSSNIPPVAGADTLTTSAGTQAVVNVLVNDTDGGDGVVLSVIAYDALSANGATVNCTGAGSCTYMPVTGFSGADSFTYRVSDGIDTAVGLVNVIVTAPPGGGGGGGGGDFQQDGSGLLSMEAEHFQANVVSADGHQWLSAGAGFAGYSGTDALRAMPADKVVQSSGYASTGARLGYQVNFARTGKHYVWVRAWGPSSSSNSLHVGLDGQEVSSSKNITVPITGGYVWIGTISGGSRATMSIGSAGQHTVNVWMRESGTVIDKVVLSTDATFDPSTLNGGQGPNESPQSTPVPPSGLAHYWKFDETSGSTFQDQMGAASAACTNCPAQVTGRISRARSFNGSTNEVNVTSVSTINWASNSRFSIEFWMKTSSCGGSQAVLGRHDPATQLHWWVGCQNGNAVFNLVDKNGGGSAQTLAGSSNVANGSWHHIVAIRDAISGQNRLYVDGAQQVAATVSYAAGFDTMAMLNIGWLNKSGADYHFAGSIDEVAIHNRVVPDSEIRRHYTDGAVGLRRGYQGCGAPVRIMALGDSNTRHWNPGFRPLLYFNLMSAGADFDMVGGVQDSCAPNCAHDPDNEGHSGHTPTNIATNVATWLNQNPADVVMLHIGTNVDPSFPYPSVTQVGQILDLIKGYNSNIPVVLARIINKARGSYDPQLTLYNQNLNNLAQSRINAGDKVIVVNMEPALGYSTSTTDFAVGDDLHPTTSGYAKMTPVWFEGLNRFMPACVNVIPHVISQPVTTASRNRAYVYVAEATGVPAPNFSLTVAPAGMTIHPDTGRLEWTPASAGSYGVTVKVANLSGSSTQTFTLVVN